MSDITDLQKITEINQWFYETGFPKQIFDISKNLDPKEVSDLYNVYITAKNNPHAKNFVINARYNYLLSKQFKYSKYYIFIAGLTIGFLGCKLFSKK